MLWCMKQMCLVCNCTPQLQAITVVRSSLLFRCTRQARLVCHCRAQLQAVTAARILVGSHGAALADVIAMEPGAAALLEVWVPGLEIPLCTLG